MELEPNEIRFIFGLLCDHIDSSDNPSETAFDAHATIASMLLEACPPVEDNVIHVHFGGEINLDNLF